VLFFCLHIDLPARPFQRNFSSKNVSNFFLLGMLYRHKKALFQANCSQRLSHETKTGTSVFPFTSDIKSQILRNKE
jgi:hypothetical protein